MRSILVEIGLRIRSEMDDLNRVVERAQDAWRQGRVASENQDIFIDSVALNLHSFYSGLERLFELITRHIDGSVRDGETWHRDLLRQMSEDRDDERPAVIGSACAISLDEFRRFRHLVRNVYTMNLVPENMESLLSAMPSLWTTVKAELLAFADFAEDLAGMKEE